MSKSRFVWYELVTNDVPGAIDFYRKVIGWNEQKVEGAAHDYHMFARGDQGVAGVMKKPAEAQDAPSHWLGYLGSDNVEATTALAETKGARIHVQPQDIPNVGRFSVIQDPQGAYLAIFTPKQAASMRASEPGLGEFSWHELATTDLEGATRFYQDVFGMTKKEAHDMGPMGTYQIFGNDERTLGGMYVKSPDVPAPPHWLFYTRVESVDAAAERVKHGRGKILHGPTEVPGGDRIAICMDPQGAAFALQSGPIR
jgi:predicted enzyme related to lactoylglutathione lyase